MKQFINDFKKFISKGNVVQLAVAVIVGGAFQRIINSFVNDIVMPVLSLFLGRDGFVNLKIVITPANPALGISENAIYYGRFIQNSVDFLIVALVIFISFKILNKAIKEANNIKQVAAKKLKKSR